MAGMEEARSLQADVLALEVIVGADAGGLRWLLK